MVWRTEEVLTELARLAGVVRWAGAVEVADVERVDGALAPDARRTDAPKLYKEMMFYGCVPER